MFNMSVLGNNLNLTLQWALCSCRWKGQVDLGHLRNEIEKVSCTANATCLHEIRHPETDNPTSKGGQRIGHDCISVIGTAEERLKV